MAVTDPALCSCILAGITQVNENVSISSSFSIKLESFFSRYVEYDFTAGLEEKLDLVSDGKLAWKTFLADFWKEFQAAISEFATQDFAQVPVDRVTIAV